MSHKDKIGREIRPGDFVTYAKGVEMNIGMVTKLNPVMVSVNNGTLCHQTDLLVVNEQLRFQGRDDLCNTLRQKFDKYIDATPPKAAASSKKYSYGAAVCKAVDGNHYVVVRKFEYESKSQTATIFEEELKKGGFDPKVAKYDYRFCLHSYAGKQKFQTTGYRANGNLLLRDIRSTGIESLVGHEMLLGDFYKAYPALFESDPKHSLV